MTAAPAVTSLDVADDPEAWAAAGFSVEGGEVRLGSVALRLVGAAAGEGVVGWTLRDLPEGAAADLDGFPTHAAPTTDAPGAASPHPRPTPAHPNGIDGIDHIVLLTDDLGRTASAAAEVGLTPRRWRDHAAPDGTPVRQAFFVVGPLVLEVVGPITAPREPRPGVRSFGVALLATDIAATAAALGDRLGPVRPAVQPGRRIATLRGAPLGLRTPVAVMSPR